jgi:hypothetical protein
MRSSAVGGIILILIGLVTLYLLRHLVIQLVFILVGVAGIVLAVVLIAVGFLLIFGGRAFRRRFIWRVSTSFRASGRRGDFNKEARVAGNWEPHA